MSFQEIAPCRLASDRHIDFGPEIKGILIYESSDLVVDGIKPSKGDRVLFCFQINPAQNGFYICVQEGSLNIFGELFYIFRRDDLYPLVTHSMKETVLIIDGKENKGSRATLAPDGKYWLLIE